MMSTVAVCTVYYPVPAGLAPAGQDGGALYREKRLHRDFSANTLLFISAMHQSEEKYIWNMTDTLKFAVIVVPADYLISPESKSCGYRHLPPAGSGRQLESGPAGSGHLCGYLTPPAGTGQVQIRMDNNVINQYYRLSTVCFEQCWVPASLCSCSA